ncbi:prephenate dehydrogenase [Nonomuraea sp. WAC 01424]|uniref:prephenate dehydrogenase n=1 Tax=Nonomuraea sp. WAC 01424 TaxID=2203200 RepID=UPI000F7908EE|nr:prephenate dehydrogenase [Nonomuraea sp. WAC 01424]RSN05676.1 prephenate dehydrogenase [Nonomuraea sp. WAC 01424]
MSPIRRVVVIGCGLIGTSVACALRRAGVRVELADHDPWALAQAARMGAGTALRAGDGPADVVVIATPPSSVAAVLREAQARGLGTVYTDVASAKTRVLAEAERIGCDLTGYVPGHPMAGREISGPGAARAGLFEGRTWALCPHPALSPRALRTVSALASACGAEVTLLAPDAHDRAAAAVSHVPLVLSAALAARFAAQGPDGDPGEMGALPLAAGALRDVTRVAGSPAGMWRDILAHNAGPVADLLEAMTRDLGRVAAALRAADDGPVAEVLARGNEGHARIVRALSRTREPERAAS